MGKDAYALTSRVLLDVRILCYTIIHQIENVMDVLLSISGNFLRFKRLSPKTLIARVGAYGCRNDCMHFVLALLVVAVPKPNPREIKDQSHIRVVLVP